MATDEHDDDLVTLRDPADLQRYTIRREHVGDLLERGWTIVESPDPAERESREE